MTTASIRPVADDDRPWLVSFIEQRWGSDIVVAHGEALRPAEYPGFVAEEDGEPVGLVTYRIEPGGDCEIVTIDSVTEQRGIGTALLGSVAAEAGRSGCRRVWLITTNDNLDALRFYQRRGFRLIRVYPGAVEESRRLKPEIREVGEFGIPVRDELEMELPL